MSLFPCPRAPNPFSGIILFFGEWEITGERGRVLQWLRSLQNGGMILASASAVDRSDSSDSSDSSGLSPQFSPAPLPFAEEQLFYFVGRVGRVRLVGPVGRVGLVEKKTIPERGLGVRGKGKGDVSRCPSPRITKFLFFGEV